MVVQCFLAGMPALGWRLTTGPGRRRHSLLPGDSQVLDMVPDNPGTWLYHCHVRAPALARRPPYLRRPCIVPAGHACLHLCGMAGPAALESQAAARWVVLCFLF